MKISTATIRSALSIVPFILSGLPAYADVRQRSEPLTAEAVANSSRVDSMLFVAPPPPNNLGAPSQRDSGAASRSCTNSVSALPQPTDEMPLSSVEESPDAAIAGRLTALVPTYELTDSTGSTRSALVFSLTSVERPTLWFHVPFQSPHTATFVLNDQTGNLVYESEVELPESPGIVSLSLPATAPALAAGEPYQWFFKVYCQSPPPLAFVEGWLQREELSPAMAAQLAPITPRERVEFYGANGFWQDALTTAATLHQNGDITSGWVELLQAVGLEDLADKPVVCCQIEYNR